MLYYMLLLEELGLKLIKVTYIRSYMFAIQAVVTMCSLVIFEIQFKYSIEYFNDFILKRLDLDFDFYAF